MGTNKDLHLIIHEQTCVYAFHYYIHRPQMRQYYSIIAGDGALIFSCTYLTEQLICSYKNTQWMDRIIACDVDKNTLKSLSFPK